MQVVPSGGHVCNQCKWCHLVVKYGTNASGAIWWANLQLMQLAPSGGQIWNQSKWCTLWPNWQPMQVAPSGGQICNQFKKFHWNQFQTILVERFTQVMDSIPWVRCASGNVLFKNFKTEWVLHSPIYFQWLICHGWILLGQLLLDAYNIQRRFLHSSSIFNIQFNACANVW